MTGWRSRRAAMVAFLVALFSSAGAQACLLAAIYPDSWQNLSGQQLQERFLQRDFAKAELVFEAEIISVTFADRHVLARVQPQRFFKTDGQPVEWLWWPTDVPCMGLSERPTATMRVIVFGHRRQSLFARNYLAERTPPAPGMAVLPLFGADQVLATRPAGTYSKDELAVVAYLDSLNPIRARLPKLAQKP